MPSRTRSSVHRRRQPPLRQPERGQQLQPQQRQQGPQGHRHRRHVPLGRQRQQHRQGLQVHARRLARSGAGPSTRRRRQPDRHHARPDQRRPTSGSSTTAPTASTSTTTPPAAPPARKPPSASFALAAGNTNPQDIADPPVPANDTSDSFIDRSSRIGSQSHRAREKGDTSGKDLSGIRSLDVGHILGNGYAESGTMAESLTLGVRSIAPSGVNHLWGFLPPIVQGDHITSPTIGRAKIGRFAS